MKRFGAVASLLLVAAIGVGAFVYAGSDSGKGHKSSATVLKNDSVKEDSNTTVTTAKKDEPKPTTSNSVASETPVPKPSTDDNVFHQGDNEKPELDGYEARKVFVGVEPSVAVLGRTLHIQVRGFLGGIPKGEQVRLTITHDVGGVSTQVASLIITVDKRGRGDASIPAPAPGAGSKVFFVQAVGQTSGRSSGTSFKVVLKK
jgi:hypothetical protein